MSGSFPITAGFETLDWQSNTNTRITTSVSGKTQRVKTGAQFWSFKLKSPSMTRAQVMADFAFIVQQDGQAESFTIVPPEISSTRAAFSGTIDVDSAASAGASSVAIDAHTGPTNILKAGDIIKFSNHDKVYMVTTDLQSIADGTGTVAIYPPLVSAVPDTATITYNNVPVKVYFDKDEQKYITQADGTFRYEITMNEEI